MSLIAHYKLNDDLASTAVVDSTGNYNGTATANTDTLSATGKINRAFSFTEASLNRVLLPNAPFNTQKRGTIAGWFRIDSPYGVGANDLNDLVCYGGANVATPGVFVVGCRQRVDNYTGNRLTIIQRSNGGASFNWIYGSTELSESVWYHVAFVSDGSRWSIYLNGQLESVSILLGSNNGNWIGDTTIGSPELLIGVEVYDGGYRSDADWTIDDVRIYDTALTDLEIREIYNGGDGTEKEDFTGGNLLAHYKLNDDIADTNVIDSSVYRFDGTATDNTDTLSVAGKINRAFDFNGTDESVKVDYSAGLYSEIITVSFWAQSGKTDYTSNGYMVSMYDFAGGNRVWAVRAGAFSNAYGFVIGNAAGAFGDSVGIGVAIDLLMHHWAYVYNNTTKALLVYKDGELVYSDTMSTSYANQNSFITVGGLDGTGFFAGLLDDVRIYNTALTQSEIQALYGFGRTALPQNKRQHNLYSYLLGLGCTIWLPPANGSEWRSIGPVERVGVSAGGVTNNVLTSSKTSATFDGSTGVAALGTIPVNDPLQLTGACTMLWFGSPSGFGESRCLISKLATADHQDYFFYLYTAGANRKLGFISRADGVTISIFRTNDDDLVEDERVLLGFTSNGVNTWKLFLNGVSKASTLIGSYVNPPNRSGELNFGRNAINNNIYYAGGCEAVIIHPTRDLTATEQAHAWALAQEF